MTTPKLAAPELTAGQALPESTVNEQARTIEQGAGHFIFKDRDLATPPGSPAQGDCYLVATSGTGAWAGQDGKIAFYMNTAWEFITAIEGFSAWVNDEDVFIAYDGAAWVAVAGPASASEIWAGASNSKYLTPAGIVAASTAAVLTSGATITPNGNNGFNFTLTLAENATLANPTNFKAGQSGLIRITQDGTGSRTLAFGANWRFPGGAPVLSTAAGAIDLIAYHRWADGIITATLTKAYVS